MIHIAEIAVAALAGAYLFKRWGSKVTLAAVEAEFKKVETTATADVKALIAKVRAAV